MRFYERRARGIHESCKFENESMVSPDAKDEEIDASVPQIRLFELSDGLGSAPSALRMRRIPLCSIGRMQPVIFHLAVLLLKIFLGCTNENLREEEEDAEALKAVQCHQNQHLNGLCT